MENHKGRPQHWRYPRICATNSEEEQWGASLREPSDHLSTEVLIPQPSPTVSVSSAKAEEEPRIQERDGIAVAEPPHIYHLPHPVYLWFPVVAERKRNLQENETKQAPKPNKSPKSWLLVADLKALAEKDGRKLGCRTTTSGRESSLGTGRSLLPSLQIPLSTEETKGDQGEARDVLGPLCSSHTRGINALPPGAPHTHSTCSVVGLIFTSTLQEEPVSSLIVRFWPKRWPSTLKKTGPSLGWMRSAMERRTSPGRSPIAGRGAGSRGRGDGQCGLEGAIAVRWAEGTHREEEGADGCRPQLGAVASVHPRF